MSFFSVCSTLPKASHFTFSMLAGAMILVTTGCATQSTYESQPTTAVENTSKLDATITNYQQGSTLPATPLLRVRMPKADGTTEDVNIANGGYGSDAVAHPTNPMQFYAITDRGPNAKYKGSLGNGKIFPTPNYTPRIGLFELKTDGSIVKIKDILLKDKSGKPITGLPNQPAMGGTNETPYDLQGDPIVVSSALPYNETSNPIKHDDYGLDAEGLVALKDGTFWVSDEYGPHLVHFDATGREIHRINAFAADTRNNVIVNGKPILLPQEFANRRANRGMEGLAITPDETTLVGIMQSTMDNPTKAVRKQNITRIVTINLNTGEVGQYLYQQQKAQNSNSGIVALDNDHFLVIERDGKFALKQNNAQKHIYKISLANATNLETIPNNGNRVGYRLNQDDTLGLTVDSKTLEQIVQANNGDWNILSAIGIKPVQKTLVLDAVEAFNYPHDKLEGLWVMGEGRLGLLNDDDFTTWSTDGVLEQKHLDKGNSIPDANRLYIATDLAY